MITGTNMCKRFVTAVREVDVLQDAYLEAQTSHITAIVGESGAGKTTLLRVLGCQIALDAGQVRVNGEPLPLPHSAAGARFRNRTVGFIFQEFGLVEDETAAANVALPMRYLGASRKAATAAAAALLQELSLASVVNTRVQELSVGQRQRVAIARAQINEPSLIIADEPTSNLDPANRKIVIELLQRLRDTGCAVIVATHDIDFAAQCDSVFRLANGTLEACPASQLDMS